MTKLKTLKDLRVLCCGAGEYCNGDDKYQPTKKSYSVHTETLREHIKQIIKTHDATKTTLENKYGEDCAEVMWRNIFREFANLTEEDLQ